MRPTYVEAPGRGTLRLNKPVIIEEGQRYWVDSRASRLVVEDERGQRHVYPGEYRPGRTAAVVLLRWSFIAISVVTPPVLGLAGVGGYPAQEYASASGMFVAACWSAPSLLAAFLVRRPQFILAVGLGTLAYAVTLITALVYFPPYAALFPLWATVFLAMVMQRFVRRGFWPRSRDGR